MKLSFRKIFLFTILLSQINMFAQNNWTNIAPGIWSLQIGKKDAYHFYSILNNIPKTDALKQLPDAPFPLPKDLIQSEIVDGKTYLHFPLNKSEKIYGFGLQFQTVEQRGRIMKLHVDHYGGSDNGRTHAPVPFYISSEGYGVLINTARYIDVWCGTAVKKDSPNHPIVRDRNTDPKWDAYPYSDNIEMLIPTEGVEIIVFAGPTSLDAVKRYNLFNGGGCLPPKWGLGFWQRTPTLYTQNDVIKEVKEYEEHNFPLTVIGLEPGWQTKAYPCSYQWDKGRFPDPEGLIKQLGNKGVYTNLWVNPYVSPDSELFDKIKPFTASHTVWTGIVPDYSIDKARNLIEEHWNKNILSKGVSGFKMDENDGFDEWLWPDVTRFPSGISAEQMRQTYGLLMQKLTSDMYRKLNKRTYGLVRASNAGASSLPYVIYNDYYSHRDFITALINSSFSGILWTPEVRGSKNAEEWLRRMQTVCFSPLAMINAWADGSKPWTFPEVEKQVKDVANLRMMLIPYLYTNYADYAFYGNPPIKAMNLVPGFVSQTKITQQALHATENPYQKALKSEMKDQFMVGDDLLVAPLFEGQKKRSVVLPEGKWYDFYTGKLAGESEVIEVSPGLDKIPVFVRDGAIIPMYLKPNIQNTKQAVEIRVYGNKENTYQLYDDDGTSFNYEKGDFVRIALQVKKNANGKLSGNVTLPKGKKLWSFSTFSWKFMSNN